MRNVASLKFGRVGQSAILMGALGLVTTIMTQTPNMGYFLTGIICGNAIKWNMGSMREKLIRLSQVAIKLMLIIILKIEFAVTGDNYLLKPLGKVQCMIIGLLPIHWKWIISYHCNLSLADKMDSIRDLEFIKSRHPSRKLYATARQAFLIILVGQKVSCRDFLALVMPLKFQLEIMMQIWNGLVSTAQGFEETAKKEEQME